MKTHEIVSAVRESAGIDTHEHAEQAVKATLNVLSRRLATEAKDLASQLPPELSEQIDRSGQAEKFDLEEFYQRVAETEGHGCTPQQARQHARAVTAAIREAVGPEYRHMASQLPDDWAELLHGGEAQY